MSKKRRVKVLDHVFEMIYHMEASQDYAAQHHFKKIYKHVRAGCQEDSEFFELRHMIGRLARTLEKEPDNAKLPPG